MTAISPLSLSPSRFLWRCVVEVLLRYYPTPPYYSILQLTMITATHLFVSSRLPPQEMTTSSSSTPILLPKMTTSADNKAMEEVMAQQVADASSTNSFVALDDNYLNPDHSKTFVHASANSVVPQEKKLKNNQQYQDDKVSTLACFTTVKKTAKQFQIVFRCFASSIIWYIWSKSWIREVWSACRWWWYFSNGQHNTTDPPYREAIIPRTRVCRIPVLRTTTLYCN